MTPAGAMIDNVAAMGFTEYDASLEWYFRPSDLLSIAVFKKDVSAFIANEIVNITIVNKEFPGRDDFRLSRPRNGNSGEPFLAWRPGHVPAGKKTSAILSAIDFLPTFCAMAGYAPPAGVELDGKDVSDVLLKGAASPHDAILLFNNEDIVGIRTQRWKFVAKAHWRGGIQDFSKRGYDELYDVEADPSESYSVAERHPEVVTEMKQRLAEAQAKFDGFRKGIPPFFQKAGAPKATHD